MDGENIYNIDYDNVDKEYKAFYTFYDDPPPEFRLLNPYPESSGVEYSFTDIDDLRNSFVQYEQERIKYNEEKGEVPKWIAPPPKKLPLLTKEQKAILQTMNEEDRSNYIYNLSAYRSPSKEIIKRSYGTVRYDVGDNEGMSNPRMGGIDNCISCPPSYKPSQPICTRHGFHVNAFLAVIHANQIAEKRQLEKVIHHNCSSSLLRTGAISRKIDELVGLNPHQPIEMTDVWYSYYMQAGWPTPTKWKMTIEDVRSFKLKSIQLQEKFQAAKTSYLVASNQQYQMSKWPKKAKNIFNESLEFLKKCLHEYRELQGELSTLPVNIHTLYNKTEQAYEDIKVEISRVNHLIYDIAQDLHNNVYGNDIAIINIRKKERERMQEHIKQMNIMEQIAIGRLTAAKKIMKLLYQYVQDKIKAYVISTIPDDSNILKNKSKFRNYKKKIIQSIRNKYAVYKNPSCPDYRKVNLFDAHIYLNTRQKKLEKYRKTENHQPSKAGRKKTKPDVEKTNEPKKRGRSKRDKDSIGLVLKQQQFIERLTSDNSNNIIIEQEKKPVAMLDNMLHNMQAKMIEKKRKEVEEEKKQKLKQEIESVKFKEMKQKTLNINKMEYDYNVEHTNIDGHTYCSLFLGGCGLSKNIITAILTCFFKKNKNI